MGCRDEAVKVTKVSRSDRDSEGREEKGKQAYNLIHHLGSLLNKTAWSRPGKKQRHLDSQLWEDYFNQHSPLEQIKLKI